MSKKSVLTTTVGFFIIGLLAWMHGLPLVGWVDMPAAGPSTATVSLAIILGALGVLAYFHDDALNGVIFLGFAALVGSHSVGALAAGGAYAWNLVFWAVFFLSIYWAARKGCANRAFFVLALGLSLAADAVKHGSGGSHLAALVEGYLGLLAGVLALVKSARTIMHSNVSEGTQTAA
ncbi:MAG TPA: hypothetical protein VFE31_06190 [Opitutaceae bacterium]|jgi:hypothetical protein|nr:hypothetical protein [Opitutaceae bacterium]